MIEWPTTLEAAQAIQNELRQQVRTVDDYPSLHTVAGVDAGYEVDPEQEPQNPPAYTIARAVIVTLEFPSLRPLDYAIARRPAPLPYVPGFLSFREGPAILAALESLPERPDMLIFDGQGIAHPRRLGIASHIGVLTNMPSIGCAKSLLVGRHAPLSDIRGSWVPLFDHQEIIGAVLRTRSGTKPVYISAGHRVSLESAIDIVMACTTRYRLPETTRAADGLASHGRVPQC